MSISSRFLLIILLSTLVPFANAQEPNSIPLLGVWTGRELGASEANKLVFKQGDKMSFSFEEDTMEGRYEIDSSKTPNMLVFYPDKFPDQKAYASIEIKSVTEIHLSHLCDGTPAALAKQSIITFTRSK